MRLGELERFLDDLDALALQHIRKTGVVREMSVVELGDQLVVPPIAVVKQRRDDAARLEPAVEPDAVEQLERRGVIGSGARHLFEDVVVPERFDQADRDAGLCEGEREAKPDRPGADHDHAACSFVHGGGSRACWRLVSTCIVIIRESG